MKLVMYRVADAVEADAFFRRAEAGGRVTVALRKDELPGLSGTRLCLVIADSAFIEDSDFGAAPHLGTFLVAAGIIRPGGRATTIQRRWSFDPLITLATPIDISQVEERMSLTASQKAKFDEGEQYGRLLPPATSAQVWKAVLEASGEESHRLTVIAETLQDFAPSSAAQSSVLLQERDALLLAMDVFGAEDERRQLRLMSHEQSDAPFLSRLADSHQLEDQVINADARNFLDWTSSESTHVAAMTFTNGKRKLTVVNANKTAIEKTTGADLVYYNHRTKSFVLVQYKMMSRQKADWIYYPDGQFADEKARLEAIETHQRSADAHVDKADLGQYRLAAPVTYFKFCRRNASFDIDTVRLMSGAYVATEFVAELMKSMKGRGGAPRVEDKALHDRSIANGPFADLVASGLIGTRGTTTEELNRVLAEGLESGRSVVFAMESAA